MAGHAAPLTIGTNDDFASGVGKYLGGTLGIPALRATCERLATVCEGADMDPVLAELDTQEERVIHACDKFLRRYDPPGVAVFPGAAYALFAADTLQRYLDAEILCRRYAQRPPGTNGRALHGRESWRDWKRSAGTIAEVAPDLVIGSSFERSLCADRAFVGIIPPLRGQVRLAHPPLAGTGGTLHFVERCPERLHGQNDVNTQVPVITAHGSYRRKKMGAHLFFHFHPAHGPGLYTAR